MQDLGKKAASMVDKGVNWAMDTIGRENMGLDKGYQFKIPQANSPSEFPGTYVETPKFYQYAPTDSGVEISFLLSNTVTREDADKNQKLIKNIIEESRPRRGGAIELTFPRLYEIEIPGLRFIKWAYLANAAFNLVGQRRLIAPEGGGKPKIVPEAYAISLVFNSLTIEVENLFKVYTEPTDGKQFYFYNILNKIEFPKNLDSDFFDLHTVKGRLPLTTVSHHIYDTMHNWWILYLINLDVLRNKFYVDGGTQLKFIKPPYLGVIFREMTNSTVFGNRHF